MIFAYQCTICIRKKSSQNRPLFAPPLVSLVPMQLQRVHAKPDFFRLFLFPLQGCRKGGGHAPPPQFLADHLTLFQPVGGDYANHITTGPSRFLDLPPPLSYINTCTVGNFRFLMHGHKKVLLH